MINLQKKNINIPKIVAIFLLLIIFGEWLPYFVEITLFFMIRDFGDIVLTDILQIAAVFFVPLISFIYILITRKYKERMLKISKFIVISALIVVVILSWLYYIGFYQLWDLFMSLFPVSPFIEVIGFHADLDPSIVFLFLWNNTIIFYILVPSLIVVATEGNGFLKFDINFDISILLGGIYLFIRPGSFAGIPYRFSVMFIISVTAILCSNVIFKETSRIENENNEFILSHIPNMALAGVFMIFLFWLGSPGWLSNGYMFYSWTWIFLTIGIVIRWFLGSRIPQIKSKKIGSVIFAILFLLIQLVVLSNISSMFLSILPLIIPIAFILITLIMLHNDFLFKTNPTYLDRHKFLNHPIRFFFLAIFGLIGYLLPFLSCLVEPITIWAVAILETIIFVIPFIILIKFK